MKNILFVLLFALIICNSLPSEDINKFTLINKFIDNYKQHSSITYQIEYKRKSVFKKDTNVYFATCNLIRDENDSLFNGYFWIKTDKNNETIYDLNLIYLFDPIKSDLYIKKQKLNQKSSASIYNSLIDIYFLNPDKINKYQADTNNEISMSIENENGNEYYHIIVKIPGNGMVVGGERHFFINKQSLIITKSILIVKYQNDFQYEEWNIKNVVFDKTIADDIIKHISDLQNKNNVIEQNNDIQNITGLLEISSQAPMFNGIVFQNNENFSFEKYKDSLVLLDFWYMSCRPCNQFIPYLEAINNEFKIQGLKIFGLNSFDKNNPSQLAQFITKQKISYPVILTDINTDNSYHVKGYPTCYILNKGKVIFSKIGFSSSLIDTIRKVIQNEIDKK